MFKVKCGIYQRNKTFWLSLLSLLFLLFLLPLLPPQMPPPPIPPPPPPPPPTLWQRLEHWLLNNNVDVFFVFQTLFSLAIRYGTLVLGPVLIVLACTIASGLFYLDFTMILPLLYPNPTGYPLGYLLHLSTSCFFLGNVVFNYFMCVTTRNDGRHYDRVVRELAAATDYEYPETEEEALAKRKDFEKRIVERNKANRRRAAERERKQMEAARHLLGNMDPDTSDEESAGQPNTEGQLSAEGGEAVDPQTPVRSWQVRACTRACMRACISIE